MKIKIHISSDGKTYNHDFHLNVCYLDLGNVAIMVMRPGLYVFHLSIHTRFALNRYQGPKLQCSLKVEDDLSKVLIFQNVTLNVY